MVEVPLPVKWGLRLLKSGFATTFVDNAAAMVEQARRNAEELGEARAIHRKTRCVQGGGAERRSVYVHKSTP